MNIHNFNRNLADISHLYDESLSMREALGNYRNEEIIDAIVKEDQSLQREDGCVRRSVLLQWVNSDKCKQMKNISIDEMTSLFPFEKISYTVLITTCLKRNDSKEKNKSIPNSTQSTQSKIIPLLAQIIRNSIEISNLRKQLIPMIELYIPMSEKNLTLEELKDYLLLGGTKGKQQQINPRYVMMALNGTEKNDSVLEFELYQKQKQTDKQNMYLTQEMNKETNLSTHSMSRIQQIMDRLNKRVDNFGNEWLINKPQSLDKKKY